jgi:hypothetical protein
VHCSLVLQATCSAIAFWGANSRLTPFRHCRNPRHIQESDSLNLEPPFPARASTPYMLRSLPNRPYASVSAMQLPISGKMRCPHHTYTGVVPQLHRSAGIRSARSLLFSDDVLTYVSFRHSTAWFEQNCRTKFAWLCGELALPIPGGPRQPRDRQL